VFFAVAELPVLVKMSSTKCGKLVGVASAVNTSVELTVCDLCHLDDLFHVEMVAGDLLKKTGNQDPFAERKSPVHLPVITSLNEFMFDLTFV